MVEYEDLLQQDQGQPRLLMSLFIHRVAWMLPFSLYLGGHVVWVRRCTCMCECMNVEVRGQPLVVVLRNHPPCFCEIAISLVWGFLISLEWLASELQGSACFHSSSTGIRGCAAMSSFLHGCWGWDSIVRGGLANPIN